jgi:hypothetical protein
MSKAANSVSKFILKLIRWPKYHWVAKLLMMGAIALLVNFLVNLIPPIHLAQSQTSTIKLSPQFSPDPYEVRGTAGGSTSVQEMVGRRDTPTGPCTGFANAVPDHTLRLRAFFNSLTIQVESSEDTALVVQGPGGIWCNDDFQGKNPGVMGQWLPGKYDIWVSTYAKNQPAPYVLKFSGQ